MEMRTHCVVPYADESFLSILLDEETGRCDITLTLQSLEALVASTSSMVVSTSNMASSLSPQRCVTWCAHGRFTAAYRPAHSCKFPVLAVMWGLIL